MALRRRPTFEPNTGRPIPNRNAAEIGPPHRFRTHACEAVAFQVLYHLSGTISSLSPIPHRLAPAERLRTLYLLGLPL